MAIRIFILLTLALMGCDDDNRNTYKHDSGTLQFPVDASFVYNDAGVPIVIGTGMCQNDNDCVPNDCCMATNCIDRARAPKCDNQNCRDHEGPPDNAVCTCFQGTCAMRLVDTL